MRRLLLVLAVLMLAGCGGASSDTGQDFVSGSGSVDFEPGDREPAPDITAETLDGDELALADLDGVVVLNFWASWCGPCAREAPDLVATHEAYADRGVHLLGVNVRDSAVNARSFERDFGKPYPSWYDDAAAIASDFGGIGPGALPTTIVLDEEHEVAGRFFGEVTQAQLSARIDELLEERASAGDDGGSGS